MEDQVQRQSLWATESSLIVPSSGTASC